MIQTITAALNASLGTFLTNNYSAVTDIATAPRYIVPDFDPADEETWSKLAAISNYGFVIHDITMLNDPEHPACYLKMRYRCRITIICKTSKQWDVTNKKSIPAQGQASGPLVTSVHAVATNLAKHFITFPYGKLEYSGTAQVHCSNITDIDLLARRKDYNWVTCNFEAIRLEPQTITV